MGSAELADLSLWISVNFRELRLYFFEMSLRQAEGMSVAQALAMTVAEIPVFLYSTFGQVNNLKYGPTMYIVVHKHD